VSTSPDVVIDGTTVSTRPNDTVLLALTRIGVFPAGSLCNTGDCPNCLATIDGVAHLRMCQTPVRDGMAVSTYPVEHHPPLAAEISRRPIAHRFEHTEVVVIGGGRSGRAEAQRLADEGRVHVILEAREGGEALAIYHGPVVVARVGDEIVRFHADEVLVATGAADVHPAVPGNRLRGVLTPRAASDLTGHGVDLGRVVAVGSAPQGVDCTVVRGRVTAIEGTDRVTSLVVALPSSEIARYECDTAIIDLGTYPRTILARMVSDPRVRSVGAAANDGDIPPCPEAGIVCPCSEVTMEDLDFVWERGFQEIELIKRATLAGTGTCQGGVCTPYLRSFVLDRGGTLQPTFTARPLARPMTIGEAASGYRLAPIHRTALDETHRAAGARMDRIGGWYRPWVYPDTDREYRAVREGVSLGDVGTLGKMIVQGPDAVEFLERLYPCRVADISDGRSRYALLLAESGGLMDDGLISRVDDTTFHLSFTSGGASNAEAWLRDWAHGFGADVRIMDRTHSLGAINVTGPLATELLARSGMEEPIPFMRHRRHDIAGVPCHVYRLSFTGETSYELHHPVRHTVELWNALMTLGSDLGIAPHGLQTLQTLRLEKGHVIIGMDTEPDSTPRRLGMDWAVKMDKPDFVGRAALARTERFPVRKLLVGLTMEGPAPIDGSPVYRNSDIAGYVTSAAWSPALDKAVMLAWVDLDNGQAPASVEIAGEQAFHSPLPFYDPEGARARA
jgi:glycine cleavage system aminomethyltransferase T